MRKIVWNNRNTASVLHIQRGYKRAIDDFGTFDTYVSIQSLSAVVAIAIVLFTFDGYIAAHFFKLNAFSKVLIVILSAIIAILVNFRKKLLPSARKRMRGYERAYEELDRVIEGYRFSEKLQATVDEHGGSDGISFVLKECSDGRRMIESVVFTDDTRHLKISVPEVCAYFYNDDAAVFDLTMLDDEVFNIVTDFPLNTKVASEEIT